MEQTMKIKNRTITPRLKLGGIALALGLLQTPALAVDYIWQGGDGVWDDAGRWTLLGVPGSGDSATIQNTGTGTVLVRDLRSVGQLFINGNLASTSVLSVGSLSFARGYFGSFGAQGAGGVMNVAGAAVFDGTQTQTVTYSSTINVGGNVTWSQGNGHISVVSYGSGAPNFVASAINVGAGTTFTDLGAASSSGYKILSGTNIHGSYLRTGLGDTYARNVNISGTLDIASGNFIFDNGNGNDASSASGLIKVASGSTLGLANVTLTQSSVVNNNGLVRQYGGSVTVSSGAQIGGAWQMDFGVMKIEGTHAVDSLVMNGFQLTGPGTLTTGAFDFNYGKLGGSNGPQGGGTLNVAGPATFNGGNTLDVDYNHTLNLAGNSHWTAGNGRLIGAVASSSGPAASFNTLAGTTFTDEGAASATGYKVLAGLNIQGTYLRTGLGDTYARNINVTGTLDVAGGNFIFDNGNYANTASGTINVASGSTLGLSNITFTQGSVVNNNGLVRQYGGSVTVGSGAQIGGAWQMDFGVMKVEGAHTVDSLAMNGHQLTGPGTLTTRAFTFNYGKLGGSNGGNGTHGGGTLNVTGPATFNGSTSTLEVDYNHTLNLAGNAHWTAGNGRLAVATGGSSGPDAHLNIAASATFTDEGAASASGYKTLTGSRLFTNHGTYLRMGLGETYATGFNNAGLLQVAQGTFGVDANFSNTGRVDVAAGARLLAYSSQFVSDGTLTGDGVVKTLNASSVLTSNGTIAPGQLGAIGTLTIDGDLTLTGSSVLHIDLADATADRLVVTSDVLLDGELSVWATPGLALQLGHTYTIASFTQRLSNSAFDSISWHGLAGDQFAVEYTADSVLLRVTAVPEPATVGLWALGLALVAGRKWRQHNRAQA
jgi:fibronectin-binding autotransporter adhesin